MARPEAFDQLCREHSADLVRFATLVAGNRADGQDLAQDALLEVWRRWGRGRLDDPSAYLHTVVIRRQHRRMQRRAAREVSVAEPPAVAWQDDAEERVVTRGELLAALARLPERQRVAVVLCHVYDHPTRDAAAMLQCTPAAVRSLCDRGLAGLRARLTEEDRDGR